MQDTGGVPSAPGRGIASSLIRACHPLPTVAVTAFICALAWALGWPLARLGALGAVVLIGQLSVGWSNDAHDAALDRQVNRLDKPAAQGLLSVPMLWVLALLALAISIPGSWLVAGWLGGSFHVLALLAAWAYNLRLSRTGWSWLPYAVAFGSVPAFLAYGLDGLPPPGWLVLVAALIGVSGHLANARGDIASDAQAGQGGLAVRLGSRRTEVLCWAILALACTLLVVAGLFVGLVASGWPGFVGAALVIVGYLGGLAWSLRGRGRATSFHAVLAVTAVCLVALILLARASTSFS